MFFFAPVHLNCENCFVGQSQTNGLVQQIIRLMSVLICQQSGILDIRPVVAGFIVYFIQGMEFRMQTQGRL